MTAWKSWPVILSLTICSTVRADTDTPSPEWDTITQAVWQTFKNRPDMIDDCALKIAHGVTFNPETDWPAYCNAFKDTDIVRRRTDEVEHDLFKIEDKKVKAKLASGKIWVGATARQAELSWGRPEEIHRTTTATKTREQWVYGSGNYLYIENGRVVAIQN